MPPSLRLSLAGVLLCSSLAVQAVELLPGLWEFTPRNLQVDGQPLPDLDRLLVGLENLSSAQREQLLDQLARQGVQLAGRAVQLCLGEAQLRTTDFVLPQGPDCRPQLTERGERLWRFAFDCRDAQGEGETQFLSEREFVTRLDGRFALRSARPGHGRLESHARWLGADCGGLAPRDG
jgi:hypothetical protein